MQQINDVHTILTTEQKQAFAGVYTRFAKPSWISIMVLRNTRVLQAEDQDSRLRSSYNETISNEYGFHWLRFGNVRILMDPSLATKELAPDTMILCGDSTNHAHSMVNLSYLDITAQAVRADRRICEYVVLQTFKHAPDVEIFSILDSFQIEVGYRYNIDNPEPKTITMRPMRSRGRQHERKVHKFVLADASERFRTTIYGSGTIKAKTTINIDCNVKLLDWFINGLYTGKYDLSLIRHKQRKHAYRILNETMVCTPTELGGLLIKAFGIKSPDPAPPAPVQTYFDSDSDSDMGALQPDSDSDSD